MENLHLDFHAAGDTRLGAILNQMGEWTCTIRSVGDYESQTNNVAQTYGLRRIASEVCVERHILRDSAPTYFCFDIILPSQEEVNERCTGEDYPLLFSLSLRPRDTTVKLVPRRHSPAPKRVAPVAAPTRVEPVTAPTRVEPVTVTPPSPSSTRDRLLEERTRLEETIREVQPEKVEEVRLPASLPLVLYYVQVRRGHYPNSFG